LSELCSRSLGRSWAYVYSYHTSIFSLRRAVLSSQIRRAMGLSRLSAMPHPILITTSGTSQTPRRCVCHPLSVSAD
jgi:hypothetical protein